MARRNYLVEGLSGTGKSSVYEELIRRGYMAVSTDRAWAYHADPDTGLRGGPRRFDNFVWDRQRAVGELESSEPDVLFVCGSSRDRDRFLPYFTKIFNLGIDDETMRRRLQDRTNNDFGKQPDQVELMLALNRIDEKPAGAIDVDATRPLDQVVDDVLRLAGCDAVANDRTRLPWSTSGSAIGRSFVIPVDLGRETITRIEYLWSGDVLSTLLAYLAAEGIDLLPSGHEGSVILLTSAHRERHLARLDPTEFDGAVLRRYYEELNETAAAGAGYAMLDGIAFLRDTLEPLDSATVALVIIG